MLLLPDSTRTMYKRGTLMWIAKCHCHWRKDGEMCGVEAEARGQIRAAAPAMYPTVTTYFTILQGLDGETLAACPCGPWCIPATLQQYHHIV